MEALCFYCTNNNKILPIKIWIKCHSITIWREARFFLKKVAIFYKIKQFIWPLKYTKLFPEGKIVKFICKHQLSSEQAVRFVLNCREEFWMCKMLASLIILHNSFRLETQVHFYFHSVVTHTVLCRLFFDHYLCSDSSKVVSLLFFVVFWTQVLLVFSLPVKHFHIIPEKFSSLIRKR